MNDILKSTYKSQPGLVIFLNGTSSSGKTTIAKALQSKLEEPFMIVSLDTYLNQLSKEVLDNNQLLGSLLPNLLNGFNRSIAAVSAAGNFQIVDHVLQEPEWVLPCVKALKDIQVIFVKVGCSLDELKRREKARGDRTVGMSKYQYSRVHQHGIYDVEVDTSTMSAEQCVNTIKTYLYSGAQPQAFVRLQESDDI